MKTLLHTLFLCTLGVIQTAFAQNSPQESPKITIKSFIQNGDSTKESTSVINFQDRDQLTTFIDSILGSNQKSLKQFDGLEFSGDIDQLDSIFDSFEKKFNLQFGPIKHDKVTLGVMIDDYNNTHDLSILHPIISNVIPNSPAEKCGLRKNDIIYKLDLDEVNVMEDMIRLVRNKKDGDSLAITFIRENDTLNTVATLTILGSKDDNWLTMLQQQLKNVDSCMTKPANPFCQKIIVQKSGPRLGVKVTDLDDEARKDLKAKKGGALITQVFELSTADNMGLNINDVITSLNDQPVQNVAELKSILESLPVPHDIEISYLRYGKKKKTKGTISEFSKAWDENKLMNIIDLSNYFKE